MYSYCWNNPVRYYDDLGRAPVETNLSDNAIDDLMDQNEVGGFATAPNSIDLGYTYHVNLSQAANSSVWGGGLYSNGYTAYGYYSAPNTASAQSQGYTSGNQSTPKTYQFKSETLLNEHYINHNPEMGYKYHSAQEYLAEANDVIQNGQYVPAKNAYVRFYNYWGGSNYQFVGMSHDHAYITTFHIKSAYKIFS